MFDRMLRCCDELGKTLQPRLVLDCALIDVATVEPLVPLGDLIERLGELEHRVRGGAPVPPKGPARPQASGVRPQPAGPKAASPEPEALPITPSGPVPKLETAASGSGPHRIPSTPAEILREWEHVLGKLEAVHITLSGAFEPARVLAWTAERLELGFPAAFEANKDLAEGKLGALRDVVSAEYGHSPKISIRTIDDAELAATPARSVLEASREKSSAERSKREAEAREHPMTKHVLQTFGGHIKEIKTDV
jgi:DNA polymerase-3 subunit gamma/tau